MNNRRERFSLILPKIDQDHQDVRYVNELNSPNSFPHEKEQIDLSFPSLLDNNNNNINISTRSKSRFLEYTHVGWSRESTRQLNSELCRHRNAYGMTVREEKKPTLKLHTENIVNKFSLTRDKHIAVSPMMERKFSKLHADPRYHGVKCTICGNKRVRQEQARVKNCSILKDSNEVTKNRLMQGIQRQDAVDIDESIELGSIKKCCAWMDTWFTEDGKPKEDTDDDEASME